MRRIILAQAVMLALGFVSPVLAQDVVLGKTLESLLAAAKSNNPEYAALRHEADAAGEKIEPAGALPDPKIRTEWMDITRMGAQNATLSPSRVGSTQYTLMQDLPWYGKRDLKREIAALNAEGAQGLARGSWSELAAQIKAAHAQRYYLVRNKNLTQEILDLMTFLEKIARARYARGLATQQDVIRAQIEQTGTRNELIVLGNEDQQLRVRVNALLARPALAQLAEAEQLRPISAIEKLDYSTLEARVRAQNPQLFAEDSRIKAAEKNRDLTYLNRYPDFSLGISNTQTQHSAKEWALMVEINIPLQQGSRRAQERESEAMLSAARARKDATANQILADLSGNLAALEAAQRSEMLATSSLLPQAELGFKAALVGYENGKVDFSTLLDAQKQIRQAKQNQIKAQAEAQIRLAEIEKLLGEDL